MWRRRGTRHEQVSEESVRYLGSVWDNPALGPGESHIYAVQGLVEASEPKRDAQEFVTLHWVTLDWLQEAIACGEVRDRVLIAAVLQFMLHGVNISD